MYVNSVAEILEAIRGLPQGERARLVEALAADLENEPLSRSLDDPPEGSNLEVRRGFYVYTGPVDVPSTLDHRLAREERVDHFASGARARRD